MLIFYFAPRSSSMAVHIALHEVGATFEPRPLSLARDENHEPGFLAINPEAKVPVLVIDGRPLTEVAGILFYIARRYPEAALLPIEDSEAEARVVSWMSFLAATAHPVWRTGGDEAARLPAYRIAEQRLGDGDWILGNRYSIADIHLFRLFWRFHAANGIGHTDFPRLFAHHDRMLARAAVQKTLAIEVALA